MINKLLSLKLNTMADTKTYIPAPQNEDDELGLTMNASYEDAVHIMPSEDKSKYNKMASGDTDVQPKDEVKESAGTIFKEIGSSFIVADSDGPAEQIDFMSILNGLQAYNNGKSNISADTAKFYEIINKGLKELGIDSNSDYAQLYIKEIIKGIANADGNTAKKGSDGIKLSLSDLTGLDKNGNGTFFDEVEEISKSAQKEAQKNITAAQIQDEMDSDGDGYISYEELETAFNNGGNFAKLFADENGNIDKALFYAVSNKVNGKFRAIPSLILAWLDQNKDGKITAEDIEGFKTNPQADPMSPKDDPVYRNPYQDAVTYIKNTTVYRTQNDKDGIFKFSG